MSASIVGDLLDLMVKVEWEEVLMSGRCGLYYYFTGSAAGCGFKAPRGVVVALDTSFPTSKAIEPRIEL